LIPRVLRVFTAP